MGGDEGLAGLYPIGGAAEARERQGSVESGQDGVRLVFGVIFGQDESSLGDLLLQAWSAEDKQAMDGGHFGAQIRNRGLGRGVKLVRGCGDTEIVEVGEVISDAFGRVVGEKSVADAKFFQPRQEG